MTQPPPIVPGTVYQSGPLPVVEPEPMPRRRSWRTVLLLATAALLVGGAGGGALRLALKSRTAQVAVTTTKTPEPKLLAAHRLCRFMGSLADENKTLVLDMAGKDFGSGLLSYDDIMCYLGQLGTPAYVVEQMKKTRALDGRQTAKWGTFEASWTYHPDQGLDIIIRDVG